MNRFRIRAYKIISIAVLFGMFSLLWIPTSTAAAKKFECYFVRGAGISGVNGFYVKAGKNNGRPAYKHVDETFYITYNALGDYGEWNITTALSGGADLYYYPTSLLEPPEGIWLKGYKIQGPAPIVTAETCPESLYLSTVSFTLSRWETLDDSSGRIGVFTPSSCYTGTLNFTKVNPAISPKHTFSDIKIIGAFLDVEIVDENGKPFDKYCGLYYLYFNLTEQTKRLWESGELGIYQFDGTTWVEITSYLVDAGEFGRISFIVTHPDQYALGYEK